MRYEQTELTMRTSRDMCMIRVKTSTITSFTLLGQVFWNITVLETVIFSGFGVDFVYKTRLSEWI